MEFLGNQPGVVVYRIWGLEGIDTAKSLIVIFNGNPEPVKVSFPDGSYNILAMDGVADPDGLFGDKYYNGADIDVDPYSATILAEV